MKVTINDIFEKMVLDNLSIYQAHENNNGDYPDEFDSVVVKTIGGRVVSYAGFESMDKAREAVKLIELIESVV